MCIISCECIINYVSVVSYICFLCKILENQVTTTTTCYRFGYILSCLIYIYASIFVMVAVLSFVISLSTQASLDLWIRDQLGNAPSHILVSEAIDCRQQSDFLSILDPLIKFLRFDPGDIRFLCNFSKC